MVFEDNVDLRSPDNPDVQVGITHHCRPINSIWPDMPLYPLSRGAIGRATRWIRVDGMMRPQQKQSRYRSMAGVLQI
jgi:hypothetical protein